MFPQPSRSTLFPYTTLFRSRTIVLAQGVVLGALGGIAGVALGSAVAVALRPLWEHLDDGVITTRSEEHTSELQSRRDLVCRLLLEKKKNKPHNMQCGQAHAA